MRKNVVRFTAPPSAGWVFCCDVWGVPLVFAAFFADGVVLRVCVRAAMHHTFFLDPMYVPKQPPAPRPASPVARSDAPTVTATTAVAMMTKPTGTSSNQMSRGWDFIYRKPINGSCIPQTTRSILEPSRAFWSLAFSVSRRSCSLASF